MKRIFQWLAVFIFTGAGLMAEEAEKKNLGQVATEWPGVKFVISKIVRTDATHVMVYVRLVADASAPNSTFIGEPPDGGWPAPPRPGTVAMPLSVTEQAHPNPFTMDAATLLDPVTGIVYKAIGEGKYSGVVTTMQPNTWFLMKTRFDAPPSLPLDAKGEVVPQKVVFQFPKAKGPIKDVVLPPDISK